MSRSRELPEERWRGWLIAAQGGDAAAYEKLLRELLPVVRGYVAGRVHHAAQREDVVQNILLSLHRARHTYRPERPLGPWLFAIARNAVVDQLRTQARSRRRERPLADEDVREPAGPGLASGGRLSAPLRRALAELPDAQREAVVLLHLEGCTVAEAAQRVGISRGALKVRAHRGYRALRARLGDRRDLGDW